MSDLMREEFEKEWGQTNEEQGLRFVAELNLYGCDLYLNSGMADRKSSAWFYFQKGWQASRECLVIELPKPYAVIGDYADCGGGRTVWDAEFSEKITDRMCKKTAVYDKTIFEALGLKVKP